MVAALCVLAEATATSSSLPRALRLAVLVVATLAAVAATLWGHMGLGREARFNRFMLLSTLALSAGMVGVLALEFSARALGGSPR